jgi:F-type H+-transporting ATPase subunit gamma
METIEALKKRIRSTEDLQSVVKTMKSLAAVKIRQFERAVASLEDYNRTVRLALRVVLRGDPEELRFRVRGRGVPECLAAVVFGSDQGMCGQLNDRVVERALSEMGRLEVPVENRFLAVVGERAAAALQAEGHPPAAVFGVPASVEAIRPAVADLLLRIGQWHDREGVEEVHVFHARPEGGAAYRPRGQRLLPVDRAWLRDLTREPWPARTLPTFTMDRQALFSDLIEQYLFAALFRAFAESLASENASRLAAMQGAERNIRDRLDELTHRYHQQRQMSITGELLDIVSGFEALEGEEAVDE